MNSILEQCLQKVTAIIADIEVAGSPLFKTVGRGRPIPQAMELMAKPSAHVIRLNERPASPDQIEEVLMKTLPLGVIIHGIESNFASKDSELVNLAAELEKALEGNTLDGLSGAGLHWMGCDSPEANQTIPLGSTMPVFGLLYGHQRGQPDVQ